MARFNGVYANLLTALTPDGAAFEPALQRDYVDRVVSQHVHGVSTSLSSGEFGYHTGDERASIIDCVCRAVSGRVPVLAGVSELTLKATCELARRAQDSGATAVMAMPRSYFVLTEAEVVHYFETLLGTIDIPIGIYNNPGATGIDIGAALYERIIALDPARIVVSKDGSGQLFRIALKHHAEIALMGREAGRRLAVDIDFAGCRRREAANHVHHRRFSRPTRA